MRRFALASVCAAAVALGMPAAGQAHKASWPIHKALCKVGVGCKDVPPRPGPQSDCTADRVGVIETIWDARLGAYVEWICTENGWRRHRIVPAVSLPWEPPAYRRVIDYHRACKSIVCKKISVGHNYPTQWALGRR